MNNESIDSSLRSALERVYREYGLAIDDLRAHWIDIGTSLEPYKRVLTSLDASGHLGEISKSEREADEISQTLYHAAHSGRQLLSDLSGALYSECNCIERIVLVAGDGDHIARETFCKKHGYYTSCYVCLPAYTTERCCMCRTHNRH